MAASIAVEEELGTSTAVLPEHGGYYAGCFVRVPRPAEGSCRQRCPNQSSRDRR
jgi:hypothetical protein